MLGVSLLQREVAQMSLIQNSISLIFRLASDTKPTSVGEFYVNGKRMIFPCREVSFWLVINLSKHPETLLELLPFFLTGKIAITKIAFWNRPQICQRYNISGKVWETILKDILSRKQNTAETVQCFWRKWFWQNSEHPWKNKEDKTAKLGDFPAISAAPGGLPSERNLNYAKSLISNKDGMKGKIPDLKRTLQLCAWPLGQKTKKVPVWMTRRTAQFLNSNVHVLFLELQLGNKNCNRWEIRASNHYLQKSKAVHMVTHPTGRQISIHPTIQ